MASTVWAPVPDSLQEIQEQLPISEVHIDGVVSCFDHNYVLIFLGGLKNCQAL